MDSIGLVALARVAYGPVMGVGFLGMVAGVWFGGRRALSAARRNLRRIIREELDSQNRH